MSFTKLPSALKNALKLASFNKNCPEKFPEISPKISPEIGLAECGRPVYDELYSTSLRLCGCLDQKFPYKGKYKSMKPKLYPYYCTIVILGQCRKNY